MDNYKPYKSKVVQIAEEELNYDIADLKDTVTELESDHLKHSHSNFTPMPMLDEKCLSQIRHTVIKNKLNVNGASLYKNQGQILLNHLETALQSDISVQSVPLLLYQFFLEQVQSTVHCYHFHMLRWKRLSEHASTLMWMYAKHRKRLGTIQRFYKDYKERAQRLSAFHFSYFSKNASTEKCLEPEDLAIFLRWIVVHLQSIKKGFHFLKVLQWLPVTHRQNVQTDASLQNSKEKEDVNKNKNDPISEWKTMAAGFDFSYLSPNASSLKVSASNSGSSSSNFLQSFFGIISNETTFGIPCHTTKLDQFKDHLQSLISEYGIAIHNDLVSSSDEMELFGAVNRQFKNLFNCQLQCMKFYYYDNVPEDYSNWGIDSGTHCLKKPSNWLNHIKIKPRYSASQLQQRTWLKENGNVDELLASFNRFLEVSDFSQVTEALKDHAVAVRDPPAVQAIRVTTNPNGKLKSRSVWNSIYKNEEQKSTNQHYIRSPKDMASGDGRFGRATKKESYNYLNTLQMLGLDEGEESSKHDPTGIRGGYLSFLHLRHLKIRDLKRQCLSILNYFRSIERMLTIYDGGLSQEGDEVEMGASSSSLFSDDLDKKKGDRSNAFVLNSQSSYMSQQRLLERGVSLHQNMSDSPEFFKIKDDRFMEFSDVSNHDDFYTLSVLGDEANLGSGFNPVWKSSITAGTSSHFPPVCDIPHVQDYRGFYIVYDTALLDLETVEKELIMMASHYIEKDERHRKTEAARNDLNANVDIPSFCHREVDRFAVLLDMWTCELNFLLHKSKLMDCFVESFHLVFDPKEKRNLSQIITDLIHLRPRYDFASDYFVRSFRAECACLQLKKNLISQVLISHMDDYKSYTNRVGDLDGVPGMPLHCGSRQEISVNLPKPALRHVGLFEYHPHVGLVATRLYEGIDIAIRTFMDMKRPSSMLEEMSVERQVLEHAIHEWEGMPPLGSMYNERVQKDIFSDDFIEDVRLVDDALQTVYTSNLDPGQDPADLDPALVIRVWSAAVDALLLRHRLVEAAGETEILCKLYKKVATQMGFQDSHFYIPPVQLECGHKKERVDPSPTTLTSFVVHDMLAKKYAPLSLDLAVRELDANNIGDFSFQTPSGFLEIIQSKARLKNIRVTLACQLSHRNAAAVAITQSENCALWIEAKPPVSQEAPPDKKADAKRESDEMLSQPSEENLLTQRSILSSTQSTTFNARRQFDTGSAGMRYGTERYKRSPEPFISLQLEKSGPRDVVVNYCRNAIETNSFLLKNPVELNDLKRNLITDFCREVSFRMSLHAMRAQTIMCYSDIQSVLTSYPRMRERFFVTGQAFEKKKKQDGVSGMVPNPKTFRKRPRRVFSVDGKSFLNLWFIPHYTEILWAFRNFEYETQERVLSTWLHIATSLRDILLFLCARARLPRSCNYKCHLHHYCPSACHWDEAEEIGIRLNELQEQIDSLEAGAHPYTKDPKRVEDFLAMKREVLLIQFDVAFQIAIRERFLESGYSNAYQLVTDNMKVALPPLSSAPVSSLTSIKLSIPAVLLYDMKEARTVLPWLSFEHSNGRIATGRGPFCIDDCLEMCFAGLSRGEKRLAGEELQSVTMLLEKVLEEGTATCESLNSNSHECPLGFIMSVLIGRDQEFRHQRQAHKQQSQAKVKLMSTVSDQNVPNAAREELRKKQEPKFDPHSRLDERLFPLDACRLKKTFLRLWKQLEVFKTKWAMSKFNWDSVDSLAKHKCMNVAFCAEIKLPVFSKMANRMGFANLYQDGEFQDGSLPPPPGTSSVTMNAELLKMLLELFELRSIADTRETMQRDFRSMILGDKVVSGTTLINDYHQQSTIFDLTDSDRSLVVRDFIHDLMAGRASSSDEAITFERSHLERCLHQLASKAIRKEYVDFTTYSARFGHFVRQYNRLHDIVDLQSKAVKAGCLTSLGLKTNECQQFYQLADRSPELIMEVTALRTKVSEMNEQLADFERDARNEARHDYELLVQSLFDACFAIKSRLTQYHMSIHDNVLDMIASCREKALKRIGSIKDADLTSTEEERMTTLLAKEKQADRLSTATTRLDNFAIMIRAFRCLQLFTKSEKLERQAEKLEVEYSRVRRLTFTRSMQLKEEADYFWEKLNDVRKLLRATDDQLSMGFQERERMKKWKKAMLYKDMMENTTRRKLDQVKSMHRMKLIEEVNEKGERLHHLEEQARRNAMFEERKQRNLSESLRKAQTDYSMEHALRQEAVEWADRLQSHCNLTADDGSGPYSRATTASGSRKSSPIRRNRSRSVGTTSTNVVQLKSRHFSGVPGAMVEPSPPILRQRSNSSTTRLKRRLADAIHRGIYPAEEDGQYYI